MSEIELIASTCSEMSRFSVEEVSDTELSSSASEFASLSSSVEPFFFLDFFLFFLLDLEPAFAGAVMKERRSSTERVSCESQKSSLEVPSTSFESTFFSLPLC